MGGRGAEDSSEEDLTEATTRRTGFVKGVWDDRTEADGAAAFGGGEEDEPDR
jgi:hypothetical protein